MTNFTVLDHLLNASVEAPHLSKRERLTSRRSDALVYQRDIEDVQRRAATAQAFAFETEVVRSAVAVASRLRDPKTNPDFNTQEQLRDEFVRMGWPAYPRMWVEYSNHAVYELTQTKPPPQAAAAVEILKVGVLIELEPSTQRIYFDTFTYNFDHNRWMLSFQRYFYHESHLADETAVPGVFRYDGHAGNTSRLLAHWEHKAQQLWGKHWRKRPPAQTEYDTRCNAWVNSEHNHNVSDLTFTAVLLGLLNAIPYVSTKSSPTPTMGGAPALGDRTVVVRLEIPNTRYTSTQYLDRALRLVLRRRRRHAVRGHWRVYRAPSGAEYHRVWIASHERGDSQLGTIHHAAYVVGAESTCRG